MKLNEEEKHKMAWRKLRRWLEARQAGYKYLRADHILNVMNKLLSGGN